MRPIPATREDAKRSKYGAKKTACALGHIHDSRLEAGRCDTLHAMQDNGDLTRLELQPEFPVRVNGIHVFTYVADFTWFTGDCAIVEDCKGLKTPVYRLKKKMVEAFYPGTVITEWPPRKRKARKRKVAA
jgi:hypothetical protein